MAKPKYPVLESIPRVVQHPRLMGVPLSFTPVSSQDPAFLAALHRHYTGSKRAPPGRKQVWEIAEGGEPKVIGYIGLSDPFDVLPARKRLGLKSNQPDRGTVNNFIYRLEGGRLSLASDILKAWLPVAQVDWELRYGEPLVAIETLIGQGESSNPGASFKAAGFRTLGMTEGRGRRRPTHGKVVYIDTTPKLVLYWGPRARLPEAP